MKKDVVFDVGTNLIPGDCFYDKTLRQELIYFSNMTSRRDVRFFNTSGKLIKIVPLDSAIKHLNNVSRVVVVSSDTIVINSRYTSEIIVINGKGTVLKKLKLASQLIDNDQNQYELAASRYPSTQTMQSLLYSCAWRSNLNDVKNSKEPNEVVPRAWYFYGHCYNAPYFIIVSDVFDTQPKITYKLPGIYKQIFNEPRLFAEPRTYCSLNNRIFFYSMYSSNIFDVNAKNFQVERKIKIESKKTKIGIGAMRLDAESLSRAQDSINYKLATSGRIVRILHNSEKNEYYCIVRHSSSVESYDKKEIPFSVLIYDNDFSLKGEYVFDDFTFDCYASMMTKNGLMILRNDRTKALKKNEKVTYCLLDFSS